MNEEETEFDDDDLSGYNRDTPEGETPEVQDLKKYYKRVLTCSSCGKVYGTDMSEQSDDGICHKCDCALKREKNANN